MVQFCSDCNYVPNLPRLPDLAQTLEKKTLSFISNYVHLRNQTHKYIEQRLFLFLHTFLLSKYRTFIMSYNPLCKVQRSSRKKKKQSRKLSLCKIVVAKEQRQVKATLMKSSRPQAQLMPTSLSCHRRTKSQDKVSNQRVEKMLDLRMFQIKSFYKFSSEVQQLSNWCLQSTFLLFHRKKSQLRLG